MYQSDGIQNSTIINQDKAMQKFKILIVGQIISSIGSGLTSFGLAIYIFTLTKSVMATGIFSICAFLPAILLSPVGGVLGDRYDRRVMMILGELLSGLGLVMCLVSVMSTNPSLVLICIGIGVSSIFTALMEPAFKATITDLLPEEDFARASGMVQIANSTKLIISPAIAGLLLRITTVSALIAIDILTFFTTAFIILTMRKGMVSKPNVNSNLGFWGEMKEGINAIQGKLGIVFLIGIMGIATFCLGFVQILSKPLILAFASETELGIISTVIALGMMVGSFIISCMKNLKSYVRLLSRGLLGSGLFIAMIGIKENIFLVAVFGFMMFLFMPAVHTGAEVLIRKNLKNEVQGRAFGLIGFITQMGYIIAFILSGALSDYIFEPFMRGDSLLAIKIGRVIGAGSGRGNALLILISGMTLAVVGVVVSGIKNIKELERG
ncbi:MFS transporter [Serpentinicella alkaliphila]|uniref:Transmembrane secretion effector n=1 Tax=Serpentinicella alkaliphila TaxID=1734049 RepID=A0A4R2TVK6_9FIRM|nr:MFS transporter [Serpentinicella alkaliphila]QUH25228.1 MFS transporter [Serpentinicella alkaliphila]TCQ07037.1 transmembrane secretion effector [Serpentinicella alkaliphila]